jgi:6-phosphogluconolactonase/glucosamine-6-phosphate isomerase/deaminase
MYQNLTHTRTAATTTAADPEEGSHIVGDDMTIRAFISESNRYQDTAAAVIDALAGRHNIAFEDRGRIEQQYNNHIRGYEWVVYAVGPNGHICSFAYRFTAQA